MKYSFPVLFFLILSLLIGCEQSQTIQPMNSSEEEVFLFTEEDADRAVLQIADSVKIESIVATYDLPEPLVSKTFGAPQLESGLQTLSTNASRGYVCNIVKSPEGRWKWKAQRVDISDDSVLGLIAAKQSGRAIDSIGCTTSGDKAVISMKTSALSDFEVFLIDFSGSTKQITQLTNNTTNDLDVSINYDGSTIVWQSYQGSNKVLTIRKYSSDGTITDTILTDTASLDQPSINSNGTRLVFRGITDNKTLIYNYNIDDGYTEYVYQRSGRRTLEHPSIDNFGLRIAWIDINKNIIQVKDNLLQTTLDIVTNNPNLEHAAITHNGTNVVYGINRSDQSFTKIKNIDSGHIKNVGRILRSPSTYRSSTWAASISWDTVNAGFTHTCGILKNGEAYCWGSGSKGELGNGGTVYQVPNPTKVTTPQGVTSWQDIQAGRESSCAISSDGQAYCWGKNFKGQLGNGANTISTVPVLVSNPTNVTSWQTISLGSNHTCGLANNDQIYCWGYNGNGQLGIGNSQDQNLPTKITNPSGVSHWISVDSGSSHTCGIATNNYASYDAYCWGNPASGQLGNGDTTLSHQSFTPTLVVKPEQVDIWTSISAGNDTTCATTYGFQLYCWGNGQKSQLGSYVPNFASLPTKVLSPFPNEVAWVLTSTGGDLTCGVAIQSIGYNFNVYCWGTGFKGDGNYGSSYIATPVVFPNGVTSIMWGENNAISVGDKHVCAQMIDNEVYCWGFDIYGAIGGGSSGSSAYPQLLPIP